LNSARIRSAEKAPHDDAGGEQLEPCREAAGAVPPADPVRGEELPPARPRKAKDVLEIRCGGAAGPDDGGVERATDGGEQPEEREPRADLEPARTDVLVRNAVAEEMGERSGEHGASARGGGGPERGAGGDVERDDQRARTQT
jgi:hypothetical protein